MTVAQDLIGVPSEQLARLYANYWGEAAEGAVQRRQRDFAMDVVDYVALLVSKNVPGGNWEAVYDTWLGRATQHALQAQALGRDNP